MYFTTSLVFQFLPFFISSLVLVIHTPGSESEDESEGGNGRGKNGHMTDRLRRNILVPLFLASQIMIAFFYEVKAMMLFSFWMSIILMILYFIYVVLPGHVFRNESSKNNRNSSNQVMPELENGKYNGKLDAYKVNKSNGRKDDYEKNVNNKEGTHKMSNEMFDVTNVTMHDHGDD